MGIHSSRVPKYWPDGPWVAGIAPVSGNGAKTTDSLILKRTHDKNDNSVKQTALRQQSGKTIDKGLQATLGDSFFTCPLAVDTAPFMTIAAYIGGAAQAAPYETARFEAARLKTGGQIKAKTIQQFLRPGLKVPVFDDTSYRIQRILTIYNPARWNSFVQTRHEYKVDLEPQGNAVMQRINWAQPPSDPHDWGINFPVIDSQLGEVFLFHGTSKGTAPFITRGGFGPEFCAYRSNFFSGYGALGQGSYLSDNLAKSATYCPCPSCGKNGPCSCQENGSPVERYALIARAILPLDTETHKGKRTMNRFAHQHVNLRGEDQRKGAPGAPQAVPSDEIGGPKVVIGLKTDAKGVKKWANNEFLFRDKAMLYPEFLVCFTWPG